MQHPDIAWPGFRADRPFVLPLLADCLDTPFGEACAVDGLLLARKCEFHVTVLSRDMARVAAAAEGTAGLHTLYESRRWTPERTGRYALLHRNANSRGKPEAWSVIEHLDFPAMLDFRASLARRHGALFEQPVPHVTHFVRGDANGIGVPDQAAWRSLWVRDVPAPQAARG